MSSHHLDVTQADQATPIGDVPAPTHHLDPSSSSGGDGPRPWIGVHFECCGVYQRVYRDASEATYSGRCPRCGRAMRVAVGPGGVSTRFLSAR